MGEVQLSGVGRGTALAVLIQQDVLCQLELIFQLVQGAQPNADAVLIEEGHLVHIRKLDAGHAFHQAMLCQRGGQCVQRLQTSIRGRFRSGTFCAALRCFRHRCCIFHLRAGRCGDRLPAVKGGQLRLVPATFQDLHPGREGKPALAGLHCPGRHSLYHPHRNGVGVVPHHPDLLQQGELLLQGLCLGIWVKTEDILAAGHPQCGKDLLAGISARLFHQGGICQLQLDGIDLKQHRYGQIDPRSNDAEQKPKGRQSACQPAAAHLCPGHPPVLAALRLVLSRAQTLSRMDCFALAAAARRAAHLLCGELDAVVLPGTGCTLTRALTLEIIGPGTGRSLLRTLALEIIGPGAGGILRRRTPCFKGQLLFLVTRRTGYGTLSCAAGRSPGGVVGTAAPFFGSWGHRSPPWAEVTACAPASAAHR